LRDSRLEILRQDGTREWGPLGNYSERPIYLADGAWLLRIARGQKLFEIQINLRAG